VPDRVPNDGIEIYIIDNTVIMETLETVVVILGNGELAWAERLFVLSLGNVLTAGTIASPIEHTARSFGPQRLHEQPD